MKKDRFIVYQNQSKTKLLFLFGLFMSGLSIVMFVSPSTFKDDLNLITRHIPLMLIQIIGMLGFIFFGFCSIYFLKKLMTGKRQEVIVLTNEGFYDYSSAIASKNQLIAWKNISNIALKKTMGQVFIAVKLNNPEIFLQSLSAAKRKVVQANLKMGYPEITITLQRAKDTNPEELLNIMQEYLNKSMESDQ